MVSIESVKNLLAEARGDLFILMQEGTEDIEPTAEWAEYMYQATEDIKVALDRLDKAQLWT